MLRGSALYIVIIIALIIGVICSSLVATAYFYRLQSQKADRYIRLQNNLSSAVNIILASNDTSYNRGATFSLFNNGIDSVTIKKIHWGIFDIGIARAEIQSDTLCRSFTIANVIDSNKWAVIYLPDDERPLSVSGKTMIKGTAILPPAGINQAYVDNHAYTGDKRLVIGNIKASDKIMPQLNQKTIENFKDLEPRLAVVNEQLPDVDSMSNSFLLPVKVFYISKEQLTLQHIKLSGNIILFCDSVLTIDSSVRLNHIIIFANSISVKSGFNGNCQLFARDTIGISANCIFTYPSCLATIRFNNAKQNWGGEKIAFQKSCIFNGTIFNYEKLKNPVVPLISIGKFGHITGQIYSQGMIDLCDSISISGSVFTAAFLYHTVTTRFENYITNATLDETDLSKYYLTSDLIPVASSQKRVLEWLDSK